MNKSRRFMCSEGLVLTYITICDFTCSFMYNNFETIGRGYKEAIWNTTQLVAKIGQQSIFQNDLE